MTCIIVLAGYLAGSAGVNDADAPAKARKTTVKTSGSSDAANALLSLDREELYPVTKVVDGDTISVHIDDADVTVRLIGVNTPETVDPRKTVECFGKEASAYSAKLLEGASVSLELDPTQESIDKYGRLLAYVGIEGGVDLNRALISEGYAYEYTYDKPYERQAEFRKAQIDAQVNGRGLWNKNTCNGLKTKK